MSAGCDMSARRGKVVWAEEKAYSSIAQGRHGFICTSLFREPVSPDAGLTTCRHDLAESGGGSRVPSTGAWRTVVSSRAQHGWSTSGLVHGCTHIATPGNSKPCKPSVSFEVYFCLALSSTV